MVGWFRGVSSTSNFQRSLCSQFGGGGDSFYEAASRGTQVINFSGRESSTKELSKILMMLFFQGGGFYKATFRDPT